jgi:DNA-binding response OmpR family regulator
VKDQSAPDNTSLPHASKSSRKMGIMNHILVIDDDRELVDLLKEYLVPEGFTVDAAFDHASGLNKAMRGEDELIILDVMLPGGSGFELLKKMRAENAPTPVLLLTARGDAVDRIVGLQIGADDYLPKPFDPRELVARIHAILRRTRSQPQEGSGGEEDATIKVGDVTLSPSTRTVTLGKDEIELTTLEFNLLEVLLRRAGTIVTREDLAQLAMGRNLAPFDRSVDVHISKLRRKLGGEEDSESRIKSIRGAGYMYAASPTH